MIVVMPLLVFQLSGSMIWAATVVSLAACCGQIGQV